MTGAGGFIGGHLVKRLVDDGHDVRAVDSKYADEWQQFHPKADNVTLDLRDPYECLTACGGREWVFNLAADMGGMGFIETHKAECMLSVLISTNMLVAAHRVGVGRFFYSSSACVYSAQWQGWTNGPALREEDVRPFDPEDGYGWEKLFSERMCRHFLEDYGLETRVARYHNVYGPQTCYDGGREKAPAAICRKVAQAVVSGKHEIEVWGDGHQVRSFTYVDDCVEGTLRVMDSGVTAPLNVGSSELVTINELVSMVEQIAGVSLKRRYNPAAPQGVRGRNSDNTLIRHRLGWEPSTSLREGLERTYAWVYDQVAA